MPTWLQCVLSFCGGGLGTKVIELLMLRDSDAAKLRAELFAVIAEQKQEIGQLRLRVENCERRWADYFKAAADAAAPKPA